MTLPPKQPSVGAGHPNADWRHFPYSIEYNQVMYQVETTKDFDAWLDGLKDSLTRKRLGMRLRKAQLENLGGGDKSTQTVDIAASVQLARLFKE